MKGGGALFDQTQICFFGNSGAVTARKV